MLFVPTLAAGRVVEAASLQPEKPAAGGAVVDDKPTVHDVLGRLTAALSNSSGAGASAAGGAASAATVDGIKAGSPSLLVTGITTTVLATMDVLRRSAQAGRNLVITFEPTFFARADDPSPSNRATDAVFVAKRKLIADQSLAVIRLRDAWLGRQPNPLVQGLIEALDWRRYQSADAPRIVTLAARPLRTIVSDVQKSLRARAPRVIGDPTLPCRRVLVCPGPVDLATVMASIDQVDVVLAGEPREWEVVEYVQDVISAGRPKALITVGRVLSEDPGMQQMARWIPSVLPNVKVEWMPVTDPYWRVTQP